MDILKLYFDELKPFKSTNEENLILYHKWKKDDMRAYDRLVRNFLPLVIKIAKKYTVKYGTLHDAISYGNEYLLKGLNSFDHELGDLAQYLYAWIQAGIIRYLKSLNGVIRIPESAYNKGIQNSYFHLDVDTGDEEGDKWSDRMIDDTEEVDDEHLRIQNIRISNFFASMSDRDKLIFEMYYGIGYDEPFETIDIANKVSLTRERVNQILSKYKLK
jgi:RNA polymerase sigma factor (sigma-70 family)